MFIGVGRGEVIGKVGMIITLFIGNPTNVRICMEMILFRMNDRSPMVRSDIHPSVDVSSSCSSVAKRSPVEATWTIGDVEEMVLASVHLAVRRSERISMLCQGTLLAKLNSEFFRSRSDRRRGQIRLSIGVSCRLAMDGDVFE